MGKALEWRANTTGNPSIYHMKGWGNMSCGNGCWGILVYVYSCWWKCNKCNRWHEHTPQP